MSGMAFKYRKLPQNHIRLLDVWCSAEADSEDALSFNVRSFSAHELPEYVAVSYQWGGGSPDRLIYLDGKEFWIRDNLWWCLYNVRKRVKWRYFWVDFICINQKDIAERNGQVQIMDKIYENALSVVVWVGLECDYRETYADTPHPVKGAGELEQRVHGGIANIAARPYWSRMWVVQEFLLAKKIVLFCGGCYVPWEEFVEALADTDHGSFENASEQPSRISPFVQNRRQPGCRGKLGLLDLLVGYRYSQCTDPRDRVFSMLSLVAPKERRLLSKFFPNYRLTLEEVVVITLMHICHHTDVRSRSLSDTSEHEDASYRELTHLILDIFEIHSVEERERLGRAVAQMDLLSEAEQLGPGMFQKFWTSSLSSWRRKTRMIKKVARSKNSIEATIQHFQDAYSTRRNGWTGSTGLVDFSDSDSDGDNWYAEFDAPLSKSFIDLKRHIRAAAGPKNLFEAVLIKMDHLVPLFKTMAVFYRVSRCVPLGIIYLAASLRMFVMKLSTIVSQQSSDIRARFVWLVQRSGRPVWRIQQQIVNLVLAWRFPDKYEYSQAAVDYLTETEQLEDDCLP